MASITIHVTVHYQQQIRRVTVHCQSTDPVQTVIETVARELGSDLPLAGWWVQFQDRLLSVNQTLEEAVPEVQEHSTIVLVMSTQVLPSAPGMAPPPPPPAPSAAPKKKPESITREERQRSSRRDLEEEETFEGAELSVAEQEDDAVLGESFVDRKGTVRYYDRMNPQRMYPLLVVIAREEIEKVKKKRVSQTTSETFEVDQSALVEIEPVLPGCHCYPPRQMISVENDVQVTFWVVPHVLGELMGSRVSIRQHGKELTEIPLTMKVVRQTVTVIMGALVLLLPFLTTILQHFRMDFASQLEDGFSLYASIGNFLFQSLSPEILGAILLLVTVGLYLWCKPRQREVFWDVTPVTSR